MTYETDNKVVGCLPPGVPGPAWIWVEDSITGVGALPNAFTYVDAGAADSGGAGTGGAAGGDGTLSAGSPSRS